jgi:peptidyl-prolyl cis-trans isomerase SurA
MIKKGFLILGMLYAVAFAQYNENSTMFTIDGDQVSVKEFVRVYTKNNINNQADFSENSLIEYLDLYEKFRLKVKEAESLGMDTARSFVDELNSYRGQLTSSYLSDRKATESLIDEAYQRMQEEVSVSHILIFWPNSNPSKADSAKVFKQLSDIKTRAEKTSFDLQLAVYSNGSSKKYPNNKQKYEAGDLGYVTVFQTVYPFESAMYNTKVGSISEPVATKFGYHLVYVKDKRKARGKMETAHVLVKSKSTDSPENQEIAAKKALQIHSEIQNKIISFKEAVKKYSEDKKTKYSGGKLPFLGSAEMLTPFANAAFSLENDGDVSTPVKTKIGWHVVQRLQKEEIKTFDFVKKDIEKRVERDTISNVDKYLMINDSKNKFGFTKNGNALNQVFEAIAKSNVKGKYNIEASLYPQNIFTIGKKSYTQADFINFVKGLRGRKSESNNTTYFASLAKTFESREVTKYREANLEEIDQDFKNLMQEYHDGILLFELTNKEVWTKAVDDTLGLKKFFDKNRNNYVWKDRVSITSFNVKDVKSAAKIKKYLAKGKDQEFIVSKINKKEKIVSAEDKTLEKDANDFVKQLEWEVGSVAEEKNLDGSVLLTVVNETLAPSNKELKETRGYVISDYQEFLEKVWISKLRKKFLIVNNNEVFEGLIK